MKAIAAALVATLASAPLLVVPFVDAAAQSPERVDGERLNRTIATLKTYGGTPDGGSVRVAYSDENRQALTYLAGLMADAGLETHIDVAGNLIGRSAGTDAALAPIVSGSHVDTVPDGGHYDGVVGVMAAIEVARTLNDAGHALRHPLEIVVWSNEEGGKTGSRAMNGSVEAREFDLPSLGDKTLGDGMRFLGGDPARLDDAIRAPGSIAGYVELHVEQGAVLHADGVQIGVVDGIVGIRRWNVTVDGFANHAGTTPMDQRRDAMLGAARMITEIRDVITAAPGRQVGTVGRLAASPGAPNVIPGRVVFSLEIRDLSMEKIGSLYRAIAARAERVGSETDTTIRFEQFYESPAAITDPRISDTVYASAAALGLSAVYMSSGAGHDAQSIAPIAPIGMIFVPSVDGISHAPGEFTSPADITNGANVLLGTVIGLDALLD